MESISYKAYLHSKVSVSWSGGIQPQKPHQYGPGEQERERERERERDRQKK